MIEIDSDLNFLNGFVQKSINEGGKSYQTGRNVKSLLQ
jgi:hypothetical protein